MPRILLLHASVGMGHFRAATALAHALKQSPGVTTEVEDTLRYARAPFRRGYADVYLHLFDNVPKLWDRFYTYTNRPPKPPIMVAGLRLISTKLGLHGLPALLEQTQPHAIICTHFLPLEVLGPMRRRGDAPPLYCVVTDYYAHQFWKCPGVDEYFVPTPQVAAQLRGLNIPPAQIQVTGIPIDPSVSRPLEQTAARRSLGLPPHAPVVFVNGSGLAAERIRGIVLALLDQHIQGTLAVATGRNHELLAMLSDIRSTSDTYLRLFGPQPSLDPLIAASSVVIGKPGGLTVSEVLARGVPMIFPMPASGQEYWNADYVARAGGGLCRTAAVDIAATVTMLLRDRKRLQRMSDAARAASRPRAAEMIARHVLEQVDRGYLPALRWGTAIGV